MGSMISFTNLVMLRGRVGKDPEMRFLNSGAAVCNFSMATEDRWVKDGEEKKQTEWHKVTAFGDVAEFAGQALAKGSPVAVCGKLRTRNYEKDGRKIYVTEVIAETVMTTATVGSAQPAGRAAPASAPVADDDDIPF